jgi:DNA-3-methyladenine glycosylase II
MKSASLNSVLQLDDAAYSIGLRVLSESDAHLASVICKHGPPPMWVREPGFPTLVYLILEQQVSLASAKAAYDRLLAAVKNQLTPKRFLKLNSRQLKRVGFSRQKMLYARILARELSSRKLDLQALHTTDDEGVRARLTALKGIGPWTAENYLLFALRRPDVWPAGDLALQIAVQQVKGLRKRPTPEKLHKMSKAWQPWRSVATRIFWHHYLSTRRSKAQKQLQPIEAQGKQATPLQESDE